MKSLKLDSPAKINLFLRVVGSRPDGYHELASLFQTVSLCDTLEFRLEEKDGFTCSTSDIPADDSNLVIKALQLFRRKTGLTFPVRIHLEKRIPIQAGLGGGSSNAATVLWALKNLSGKNIPLPKLQEWASELGSDVPFFFSQGTAYCTGRGEKVTTLAPPANKAVLIVKPAQGLPTPAVYKRLKLGEIAKRDPEEALQKILKGEEHYFNDLEEPAFALYPQLSFFKKQMLDAGFKSVVMTGSGSALLGFGDGAPLCIPNVESFRVTFLNRSGSEWYNKGQ